MKAWAIVHKRTRRITVLATEHWRIEAAMGQQERPYEHGVVEVEFDPAAMKMTPRRDGWVNERGWTWPTPATEPGKGGA